MHDMSEYTDRPCRTCWGSGMWDDPKTHIVSDEGEFLGYGMEECGACSGTGKRWKGWGPDEG